MKRAFQFRRLAIWPTLPPHIHFRPPATWTPFPLDQAGCRIYSRARHAIWQACRALGLGEGDVVLVPAYHHGSEIEALLQAGLRLRYYEPSTGLEPVAGELESLLGPEVRALYLIHYLGFPQDAAYWRQWCDERGLWLMEDAAQAFLATRDGLPVGSLGHMGVFCLYKTYGIPDGGAVISVVPPPPPTGAANAGMWGVFKRHFNWVAQRRGAIGFLHLHVSPLLSWWKKRRFQPHQEFALQDPNTPPAAMTTRLIPRLVDAGTAERRRENYRFLLRHLGGMVPPPFQVLPEGACPFAFPVEVDDARAFLQRLRSQGVVGLLFWFNPHPSLPVAAFPRSRALRERVLALPVHQELTSSGLRQIVDAVLQARLEPGTLTPVG
jgi:perosamine synthetase